MSKIALQMYTMRNHTKTFGDVVKTFTRLREIGYENLQYTVPDELNACALKNLTEDLGIKIISSAVPLERVPQSLGHIEELSGLFGFKYIGLHSIPYSFLDSPEKVKEYCGKMNDAGKLIKPLGLKFLYHSHAFEYYKSGHERVIDLMENYTDPDTVTLMPDTHWIQSGGMNPADYILKHAKRIDFLHFKDYAIARPADGEKIEFVKKLFAPVGEGNLDWPGILKAAKSIGAKYYIVEQDDCYGKDEFECVAKSYDFLKKAGADQ